MKIGIWGNIKIAGLCTNLVNVQQGHKLSVEGPFLQIINYFISASQKLPDRNIQINM